MTSKPTKRGQSPFHLKRALTPFCFLLISGNALAQQSVIDHCKQTSSDADRIACLEAALLGQQVTESEVVPSVETEIIAIEETVPVLTAEPAPVAEEPSTEMQEELPSADVAAEAIPEGIGAEQVTARNQTREEQEQALESAPGLIVAKYEWVPYERLVVTFENGQVWRQIKGDTNRIRTSLERNQTADITESGLGGYKLRLNEIRRTIRVERIR